MGIVRQVPKKGSRRKTYNSVSYQRNKVICIRRRKREISHRRTCVVSFKYDGEVYRISTDGLGDAMHKALHYLKTMIRVRSTPEFFTDDDS